MTLASTGDTSANCIGLWVTETFVYRTAVYLVGKELNDIPAFLNLGVSSETFGDMIIDQFDVLYEEGATNARCMPICLHTFQWGKLISSSISKERLNTSPNMTTFG
ncbi:MAG: hypothetical protein ACU84Q_14370 [Gammaproteobacteria bacterium]